MKENKIFKLYNRKIKGIPLFLAAIIFLMLIIVVIFSEVDKEAKMPISSFLVFFCGFFIWQFCNINQTNKMSLFIKENGKTFRGCRL